MEFIKTRIRKNAWWMLEWLHHGRLASLYQDRIKRESPTKEETEIDCKLPLCPINPADVYNPVLTATDVTDFGQVEYVADPFICFDDTWHMFFEVYNDDSEPDAAIGHATSPDGRVWTYQKIVLNTGFHLSYPFVFQYDEKWYLLPEQEHPKGPRLSLYEANPFPTTWRRTCDILIPEHQARDPVVFEFRNHWWLLVADTPNNEMYLYYADEPTVTEWSPHAENPVGTHGPHAARPGGRPIITDDSILLFYQDGMDRYGQAVRVFEVTELTPDRFVEHERKESPVLAPSPGRIGWNSGCMHTFDPHLNGNHWICAVDGNTDFGHQLSDSHWSIGIYKSYIGGENDGET